MGIRRIGVDFDYINEPLIRRLIWALRLRYICSKAKCDVRRTHKGYHVRIYGEFDDDMPLRALLFDDDGHQEMDWIRRTRGLPGYATLFNCKVRKGKTVYVEEPVKLNEIVEKVLKLPTPL